MPDLVAILGKPCTGKSTQGAILEKRLNDAGILAVDTKREACEHSFLIRMTEKLFNSDRPNIAATVLENAITFSATNLRSIALKHKEVYDVVILERILPDVANVRLVADEVYNPNKSLFYLSAPLTREPDIIYYLHANYEVLKKRFEGRPNNRDRIHESMLLCSDEECIKLLTRAMRGSRIMLVDANRPIDRVAEEIFSKTIENLKLNVVRK